MGVFKPRHFVALMVVAAIFPTSFSAPTRSTCTPKCNKMQGGMVHFQEGRTYTYGFETEVVTEVIGTSDEQSKIKVKGQAVIAAVSACDFILTVQQVTIQSPSGQTINRASDIEGSSLRFAYQDGEIESVCVTEDDATWSANVKRAIISMLTNKADRTIDNAVMEADISGRCPTVYTTMSDNKYVKTRDLNSCTNREGGATVFLGVPYESISKFNSVSFMDCSLTCTQELKDGVLDQVSCMEHHKVPLLSSDNSGIQTKITSSLHLVSAQDGITRSPKVVTKSSSIFYDYSEAVDVQRQKSLGSRAVDFLNKLCKEIEDGTVSSKVPGLYLQLVKSLKSARKDDIKQMYERINSGAMCSAATDKLKTLFVEAAATSASDGSIAFVAELIANGQADCHAKSLFQSSVIFAPHPDTNALESLTTLVSKPDVDSEYLLVASAVAHQYCKMTNPNCGSSNEYKALVDKIVERVRSTKDEKEIKKVVAALQALGNMDHLTPAAVSAIASIVSSKSSGERLKVRALDAFRRDPCQLELKRKAIQIFSGLKESSHVRIQAYLALSKCFQQEDVATVQAVLNSEKSSQVGSFVASHIENMVKSASPSKDGQKEYFALLTIPEALKKDVRKFSRNTEFSTFSPNVNLGGSLEGNMIFSQDSYLPRMTSANLTIDALGRSYNLFEVGMFAEGFEHLVEGNVRAAANLPQVLADQVVQRVRNRFTRSVNVDISENEIQVFREKVDIEERIKDHGVGDIYIRVMGTSLLAESFSEISLKDGSISKNLKKGIAKMIEGAKEYSFDMTRPVTFIDEEIIIPTFSGFPLNLVAEGTSILSLEMSGNLDFASVLRGENSNMRAKLVPSAATLLKTRMTIGTGPIESGLQLEGKIHSSAGFEAKIVKEDGKFEFRFNFPQEKLQIVDMRSDLYWVEQPQDSLERKTPVQSKLTTKTLIDNQCLNTFSKVLGMKVCAEMKIPKFTLSAPFPVLNGQAAISLSIEKSESSMEGYLFKVERNTQDSESVIVDVEMDTPGSRTIRKVTASVKALNYKSQTPNYVFKLDSPWTKLDVDYKRSNTDELKGVELKMVTDGDAYNAKTQLKKTKAGSVSKYEPVVFYSLPGGRPVKLVEGQVVNLESENRFDVDLKTAGPFRSLRGSVKGTIEAPKSDNGECQLRVKNLEIASDMAGTMTFDGHHIYKAGERLDSKWEMKCPKGKKFEIETKINKAGTGQYAMDFKTRCAGNSFLNLDFHNDIKREGNSVSVNTVFTRGLEEPKVEIKHKLSTTIASMKRFEILHEFTVKHPGYNVDLYNKFDTKAVPDASRHAEFVFNVNTLKTNVRYETTGQNMLDYSMKAEAEFAEKKYEFSEVSTKAGDHKQNFKTRLAVTPGFWYLADTDVTYKLDKSEIESLLSSTITSDQFTAPVVFKSGVSAKSTGYDAFLKFDMKGRNHADFATEYKHSQQSNPATLKMKGFVLNYLEADMTHTLSRTQGGLQLDAKWIPTGRKVEVKSTMSVQGEVYDIDANLKWDAERDPTKYVSVKSVSSLSFAKLQWNSRNDINVQGKLAKFNVKGQCMKEFLNGEDRWEIDYTSPNGQNYKLATKVNLENKATVKAGNFNVKVTLPGERPYQFTWDNRVTNINRHEMTFSAVSDMKMDYKGEKDVKMHVEAGSVLPGNYRSYTGKFEIGGSVVDHPVAGNIKADIRRGKWDVTGAANRGTKEGNFDVSVNYDVWSPKRTLDVKYTINTPFKQLTSLEGTHKHGCLFNSWTSFEYTEDGSVSVNHGSPTQWKYLTSLISNEFKYLQEFMDGGQSVHKLTAKTKFTPRKIVSELKAAYKGETAFLEFDVDHKLPNIAFEVKAGLTEMTVEFKADHKVPSDGVYETEFQAKTGSEVVLKLANKLEYSPTKKSIDVTVTSYQEPSRRVFLFLNKLTNDKYNVEATLKWGDGPKYATTKGDFTRTPIGFDAAMILDSPHFRANKMNVKLSKKSQTERHALTLKVQDGNTDKLSAAFDYGTKLERSGNQKVYEGTVAIKGDKGFMDVNFNGKFRLEDTKFARQRDGEDGREWRGTFEVGRATTPIKGSAVLKSSDKEKRILASLCNEDRGRCRTGDAHFRHQHSDNGDLEYTFRITGETAVGGVKSTKGVAIKTTKTEGGRQIDHTVKLIMNNDNSEVVGYRLYRKDGHEIGGEILLPERTIATVLDIKRPGPLDFNLDLTFYIDRIRKPNRKISLIFNTVSQKDVMIGRESEIIFRHPDLGKDLKMSSKYTLGGENNRVWEWKSVIDILKPNSEIVINYKIDKEPVPKRNNFNLDSKYRAEWSVLSKGLSLNFGGKSELNLIDGQFSYKNALHYENRDKQLKTVKLETILSKRRMSFEVKGDSSDWMAFITTFDKTSEGYEMKHEMLLPSMSDGRVFKGLFDNTPPKKMQLTTYKSHTPQVFYEAVVGFTGEDNFVAGLYDHEASGKKTLTDFQVGLNNSRILFMKTNWERENIKNVWVKARSQLGENSQTFKRSATSALSEALKEAQFVGTNVRKSVPSFREAFTSAQNEFADLVVELDEHDDTKVIVQQMQAAQGLAKKYAKFLYELSRVARKFAVTAIQAMRENFEQLRTMMSSYGGNALFTMEDVQKWIESMLFSMVDCWEKTVKLLSDTADRIAASTPEIISAINWTLDATAGIGDALRGMVETALDKMAAVWSGFRTFTDALLDNNVVRIIVKDAVSLAKMILSEFIEETKTHAEAFKNYVLEIIPEQDFQELVQMTAEYLEKKTKNVAVDDTVEIKRIYNQLVKLVKKIGAQFFSFDSEHGSFTAAIPLPTPVNSLSDIWKIWGKLTFQPPTIKYNIPSYKFGISETWNKLKGGCAHSILPPFSGYGMVIGSQFYKTFDGQFFRIDGSCQYLLASDFDDGNFTVAVDYDRTDSGLERAFTIKDSQDTISIKSDNTVIINGRKVTVEQLDEVPETVNQFKVLLVRDWIVVEKIKKGVKLACSMSNDVCGVIVDGFYHGKVLGLLGKFNQEKFDDLTKPNGEIEENVDQFFESWKLQPQCSERPVITLPVISGEASEKCSEAFEGKSSPLRPCFGVIPPQDYQQICETLSSKPGFDVTKAVCTSSDAYAAACRTSCVNVNLPGSC